MQKTPAPDGSKTWLVLTFSLEMIDFPNRRFDLLTLSKEEVNLAARAATIALSEEREADEIRYYLSTRNSFSNEDWLNRADLSRLADVNLREKGDAIIFPTDIESVRQHRRYYDGRLIHGHCCYPRWKMLILK